MGAFSTVAGKCSAEGCGVPAIATDAHKNAIKIVIPNLASLLLVLVMRYSFGSRSWPKYSQPESGAVSTRFSWNRHRPCVAVAAGGGIDDADPIVRPVATGDEVGRVADEVRRI